MLTLSLALTTFAANGNGVGSARGGGAYIEWDIHITGHEEIVLTVVDQAGDGIVKKFGAGRNPVFRLSDLGDDAADGQYNYELRVTEKISPSVKARLAEAREKGDNAAIRKIQKEAGLTGHSRTQSGTFTVLNRSIVNPNPGEKEPGANDDDASAPTVSERSVTTDATRPSQPVALDQVIPDDLIVQSSTCTGFDCVDGEAFGFDTLRLKENNLRIHFEDTSTAGGYPANDWRIIANDSASGGANKFVVEDSTAARNPFTIEAAAPANSLYVDSSGNIGFQQSAPGLDLHLTTSDTPALRLEQTNAGGFTAQTWDIGGNEANFFVRDLTGGSRLSFRIRPGAPTSSIDIAADGDVGIGTASPATKMDIFTGSNNTGLRVRGLTDTTEIADIFVGNTGNMVLSTVNGGGTQSFIEVRPEDDQFGLVIRESTGVGTAPFANFYVTDTADDFLSIDVTSAKTGDFTLTASGRVGIGTTTPAHPLQVGVSGSGTGGNGAHVTTGGTWTNGSSRAFKEHVEELTADDAMNALLGLKPVRYNYTAEPEETYVGFIAEDVPELVAQTSTGRQYLSPMDIVATLTKVVQEQQKTIDGLAKKIQELENNK